MSWKIPFNKTFNPLRPEEVKEITDILQYRVINGEYTRKLERMFEETYNVKYAIACANATSGIDFALDYFVRDKCISIAAPVFTWWSTWKMSKYLKFIPCDIDKEAWILHDTPKDVDLVISVDTFGNKSKIKTDKPVIYDAAHGFGLSELGNRGIVEVVSFSFTKIVNGMQGGMILTNDDSIGTMIRTSVRTYAKMTEIEAYMCLKSLANFNNSQEERLSIIEFYRSNINVPFKEQLIPYETNYSVFAILFESNQIREKIVQDFVANSIEPKVYYIPVIKGCSVSDDIYSRIIALPIYHNVDKEKVCEVINESYIH
jgi:dTDP-4-amino-4,6-dideoxygalactose transaminase